jgi:hypothetical protein
MILLQVGTEWGPETMAISTRGLAALKSGWLTEPGNRGEGALRAKGSPHGPRFYFRYRNSQGRTDDLPLGSYDESGSRGLTLAQARKRTAELRTRYLAGDRDLRAVLDAEQREAERRRREAEEAEAARAVADKATLGALLDAYVASLKRDEKASADAVEAAVKRHVKTPWPSLWKLPAASVSVPDLLDVVAKVADEGRLREAAKLRAYIRAAYAAAVRAQQDARSLPALRELRITSNPARDLAPIEGSNNARERALSVAELRAYWKRISALPGAPGAALRFHLLTGAQRIEQLSRLIDTDLDTDAETIRLRDTKGRRKKPRIHIVPLIPAAKDALDAMGPRLSPHLFTVSNGETGASYSAIRSYVLDIADAMLQAEETAATFTPGDLRRSVETRLAAEGVSADVRAHLQSHGLGGVQARHYDRHSYMSEKHAALETLYGLLTARKQPKATKGATRKRRGQGSRGRAIP